MAIDRIDWHSGAKDFPKELPDKAGGTHIGIYLAWIIQNNLIGETHLNDSSQSVAKVQEQSITGTEFLIKECDSKLWETDLNQLGNEFTQYYYESNTYFVDYERALAQNTVTLYHIEDTWGNYQKLAPIIDKAFRQWQKSKNKKWWQFWL